MKEIGKNKSRKHFLDDSGQTFIEFIFLLVILVGLSVTILKGSNSFLAGQWEIAINSIVRNYPGHDPGLRLSQ